MSQTSEDITISPVASITRVPSRFFLVCLAILQGLAASLSGVPEEKRIAIFSVVANYSLPVVDQQGHDYVGLLELLEPLGTITAQVNGTRWRLRYNDADVEFTPNKTRGRVRNRDFDLTANFLLDNNRGLVPVSSLNSLLPLILGGPVTFHENSRRLYIGSVGVHFTAQISATNSQALVMTFTSPVNPRIATEPGKVQMLFVREPLMPPGSPTLTFDSKNIPSAIYEESNGVAQISVNTRIPLFANFSDNGRTITLAPATQEKATEGSIPPAPQLDESPITQIPAPSNPNEPLTIQPTLYFAVVDASHGGEEHGAMLSEQILEKDVTLAFARRLREQLEAKGLRTLVLRDGDSALTLEQRAILVNQIHPRIYVSVHASSLGKGARFYTSWLPPANGENIGPFVNWDTAQSGFLPLSQSIGADMLKESQTQRLPARLLSAPLRPLNNIAAPAIAIEISPFDNDLTSVNAPEYQTSLANVITNTVVAMRAQLENDK
jgi:N-acetylmuramoyl-L-alanine amidase